jgi:hypothetical protein
LRNDFHTVLEKRKMKIRVMFFKRAKTGQFAKTETSSSIFPIHNGVWLMTVLQTNDFGHAS